MNGKGADVHRDGYNRYLPWFAGMILGVGIGFALFDSRQENLDLRTELNQARFELEQLNAKRVRSPVPLIAMPRSATIEKSPSSSKDSNRVGSLPPYITREDLEKDRQLDQRKQQGEYILADERATSASFRDAAAKSIAAMHASNNAPRLSMAFNALGIPPEVSQQLQAHQRKITEAYVLAEAGITQLLTARRDYDQRMRSTLSDEDYQRYRAFEDSGAAHRECEQFTEFLKKHGGNIDDDIRDKISSVIQQAHAYTVLYDSGPYDKIPEPKVTPEQGIPWLEQRIANTTQAAHLVAQLSQQFGLPDNYRNYLEAYYKNAIQLDQKAIEMSKPEYLEAIQKAEQERAAAVRRAMNKGGEKP